ncbi:hypothetical protein FE257_011253 [Aspergillus nanangensis]|uniref:Zn(2)-C6 fungal-type domain-containing protein n=1 Tax=Aspergillus nanangensis TaxID=2582783 RepID=A0AAD4CI04_ASPNN|nr:hypothetical protein FE257_011253 [Aspergillus nanangensis]
MSTPKGPFHLVTVNTAPERAKRLIGRVAEALKDRYTIIHVDNCEKIEEVRPKVTEHMPEVLFSASMWTDEQAHEIHSIAREVKPDIKLHALPPGLQVERGPDAVVEYLCEKAQSASYITIPLTKLYIRDTSASYLGRSTRVTSAMPAKWRTKSGCLTCRIRRKKCDEESKTCRACRRNRLTCIWESDKVPSAGKSNALVSQKNSEAHIEIPSHHLTTFESPTSETLLAYFASVVLPQLLIPGTPSAFNDELLALGVQYPCVRDSFLACAAGFLSNCGQKVPVHAFKYYSNAVFSTRKMIEDSKLVGTEDWLFLLTVALCIFERIQSGPSSKAIAHLLGATRIVALQVRNAAKTNSASVTPIQQTCAAALLYHAATTAFLSPDIKWLPEYTSWEQVQRYIEGTNLPTFAMPPALCRLILEISRLARRTPLNQKESILASSLREQLRQWLPRQPHRDPGHNGNAAGKGAEQIQLAAELYALTADILLLKIIQPGLSAEDSRVQGRVKQVLSNLQSDVNGLFWNQHYSWPFAIIGCTVQRETEMLFLLGRLEKLWENSHWGDIKRTRNLLKNLYEDRKQNAQFASLKDLRSKNAQDPFNLLLNSDGLTIFSAG